MFIIWGGRLVLGGQDYTVHYSSTCLIHPSFVWMGEAMLTDLDWLGPNMNDKKYNDPEADGGMNLSCFMVAKSHCLGV